MSYSLIQDKAGIKPAGWPQGVWRWSQGGGGGGGLNFKVDIIVLIKIGIIHVFFQDQEMFELQFKIIMSNIEYGVCF